MSLPNKTEEKFKPENYDLQTPCYLYGNLLELIVGCNKQWLLLHYVYSKGYSLSISTVRASAMIKYHNEILQIFLQLY